MMVATASASPVSLSWAHVSGNRRRVVVYASKLAAVAGMHPYVNRDELRAEYERRVLGDEAVELKPAAAATLASLPTETRAVVDRVLADDRSYATSGSVLDALRTANAAAGMTQAGADAVREVLFTTHGTRAEASIREATARDLDGNPSSIRVDAAFRTGARPWLTLGDTRVFLGGKTDGLHADGRVYEFKARTRRFLGAPGYERIQMLAYLSMLDVREGVLVESYMGERREHPQAFDEALWDEVTAAAAAFLKDLLRIPEETEAAAEK